MNLYVTSDGIQLLFSGKLQGEDTTFPYPLFSSYPIPKEYHCPISGKSAMKKGWLYWQRKMSFILLYVHYKDQIKYVAISFKKM